METLLLAATIVAIVLLFDTRKTVTLLRKRIEELEFGGFTAQPEEPEPEIPAVKPAPFRPVTKAAEKPKSVKKITPETKPLPDTIVDVPKTPPVSAAKRFEDLIGGKLPIWIGGIALVFAGFFLVRYSIEAGLFGPTARCIAAALFGLILISLAEYGNRIPRFGQIFTDDARIGHSIAGAGIAVLYATLYMASELYGLFGLAASLGSVVAVTILAFILSQRHGPPTVIMGLLGGFAAPYVAGLGPDSVAPLLIYLGVFTAGLFGLAIHRGWAWLALLATGGGVIWATVLLLMNVGGNIPFIGAFVVLLAIGGVLTMSRIDESYGIPKAVIRTIPLVAGLVQLIVLAPLIEFSLMSWLFFGVLSLFAIALAWRDENMTPAVASALGLAIAMVAIAYTDLGPENSNHQDLYPAIGFAILFGVAGHIFALREKSGRMWAMIGLAAPTAMLILTTVLGQFDWRDATWVAICVSLAVTTAIMAWRVRNKGAFLTMPLAAAITAILLASALWLWMPGQFGAIVAVAVASGLAGWSRFTNSRAVALESGMAIAIAGLLMLISGLAFIDLLASSLSGNTNLYSYLPEIESSATRLLLPAAAIIAFAFLFRDVFGKRLGIAISAIGLAGAGAFTYLLAKQPLAIGPIEEFVQYGFVERSIFTHLLALSGWLLLNRNWRDDLAGPLKSLGFTLAGLALFRYLYFDILLLSPTSVKQVLGSAPIANLGTLHYTAIALWLWLYARTENVRITLITLIRPLEIASLFAAIAAVAVTVRQAVHGSNIASPPFTSAETYLYSAALLLLAIAWLTRGIQTANALLRIAGLVLMTLVTFKVFLVDAAQLDGILRILSFLGLGIALIGIGWIYGKVMRSGEEAA